MQQRLGPFSVGGIRMQVSAPAGRFMTINVPARMLEAGDRFFRIDAAGALAEQAEVVRINDVTELVYRRADQGSVNGQSRWALSADTVVAVVVGTWDDADQLAMSEPWRPKIQQLLVLRSMPEAPALALR